MKFASFKGFKFSCIFVSLLCASLGSFIGCASHTPDKVILDSEIASRESLTIAWSTFRTLRAQGKIDDNEWTMGARWMDGYKRAARAVLVTLSAYQTNKDMPALQRALDTAAVAWSRLAPILVKYYPQLPKEPPLQENTTTLKL